MLLKSCTFILAACLLFAPAAGADVFETSSGLLELHSAEVEAALADGPFDLVHLASTRDREVARSLARECDAIGVTWLLERITPDAFGGSWEGDWPVERMLERVRMGAPERVRMGAPGRDSSAR